MECTILCLIFLKSGVRILEYSLISFWYGSGMVFGISGSPNSLRAFTAHAWKSNSSVDELAMAEVCGNTFTDEMEGEVVYGTFTN